MKNKLSSIIVVAIMSLVVSTASAQQLYLNGIYYNFNYGSSVASTSVSVTYEGASYDYNNEYSGVVIIPESVTFAGKTYIVTGIGKSAFHGCSSLTGVIIPSSVTSIGDYAFAGCSGLTSVNIPNSVTSIGFGAFLNCSGLTSINIPNSVTEIGGSAFRSCSGLTSVTIPYGVTSIGRYTFDGCSSLTGVIIPSSVTSIDNYAFRDCSSLTGVIIPSSVTSIGNYAFYRSRLISVIIPSSVTSIAGNAFVGCTSLNSIKVNTGNTSYDSRDNCNAIIETSTNTLIAGCKKTIIPNSVTSIGERAFSRHSGLTSVTIPNSVTSIGQFAFRDCSNLSLVNSEIENPFSFGDYAFSNVSSDCVLEVPMGTTEAYESNGWTTDVFKGGIVEKILIKMATSSGVARSMIGYSSKYGLDFTNVPDVKACIAVGYSDKKNVLLTNVKIVPANTGIVLIVPEDKAGMELDVPITTSDYYYANMLQPAVNNVTIRPTENIDGVNYTNLMVGKDSQTDELGFISFTSAVTRSNNCYLRVPTSFYQSASAARQGGGLGIEFVDSESTDIQPLIQNGAVDDGVYYDLQGRKVTPTKKGLYISNGKKVFIK